MNIDLIWQALIAFVVAYAGTALLIRTGGLKQDLPNARSSHSAPTPRGGGVSFVFALAVAAGWSGQPQAMALATLALGCALLGAVEDANSLPASWRLLAEVALATVLVKQGYTWNEVDLFGWTVPLSPAVSAVLSVLWVVWFTNLFNFMDGINGIASLQAVANALILGLFAIRYDAPGIAALAIILIGAVLGFLPHNFPKARIFMGDAGSLLLGFLLASLSLALHQSGPFGTTHAMVVFGPFLVDATLTLLLRMGRREDFTKPHRSHAYQRLAVWVGNHTAPTLAYSALALIGGAIALYGGGNLQYLAGLFLASLVALVLGIPLAIGKMARRPADREKIEGSLSP